MRTNQVLMRKAPRRSSLVSRPAEVTGRQHLLASPVPPAATGVMLSQLKTGVLVVVLPLPRHQPLPPRQLTGPMVRLTRSLPRLPRAGRCTTQLIVFGADCSASWSMLRTRRYLMAGVHLTALMRERDSFRRCPCAGQSQLSEGMPCAVKGAYLRVAPLYLQT
jgi:hypothetical protein